MCMIHSKLLSHLVEQLYLAYKEVGDGILQWGGRGDCGNKRRQVEVEVHAAKWNF